MVNQWVEFVRKYAKDNNISYGCAVSEASPSYKKYKNNTNIKNMDKSTKKYKKTLKRAELEINAPQSKPIRFKKKDIDTNISQTEAIALYKTRPISVRVKQAAEKDELQYYLGSRIDKLDHLVDQYYLPPKLKLPPPNQRKPNVSNFWVDQKFERLRLENIEEVRTCLKTVGELQDKIYSARQAFQSGQLSYEDRGHLRLNMLSNIDLLQVCKDLITKYQKQSN
jgi:hypothetical protein